MSNEKLKFLTLKLTNRCNMNCVMCGQANSEGRKECQDIPLNLIKRILSETPEIERVYLFGGEPLLYNEFEELIDFLHQIQMPTLITTNGKLLKKYSYKIVKKQIRDVEISVDSSEKSTYEKIRGKNSFEEVFAGIDELLTEKSKFGSEFPRVRINCVILPQNYNQICTIYDYFMLKYPELESVNFEFPMKITQEIGEETNRIFNNFFGINFNSWKGFSNSDIEFSLKDASIIEEQINLLKRKKKFIYKGPISKYDMIRELSLQYNIPQTMCEYPFMSAAVLPNGDVVFCVDFPDYIIGNLNSARLLDLWHGEQAKKFRSYFLDKGNLPLCSRCTHRFEILHNERI